MKCNVKHTADILTIFKKVSDYIHPDKGKCEGHFCLVCRFILFFNFSTVCNRFPRDKGIRQAAYFFSGGTSTLPTHIARYSALYSIYHNVLSNCFKGTRTILTSTNSNARILIYLSTVGLSLPQEMHCKLLLSFDVLMLMITCQHPSINPGWDGFKPAMCTPVLDTRPCRPYGRTHRL